MQGLFFSVIPSSFPKYEISNKPRAVHSTGVLFTIGDDNHLDGGGLGVLGERVNVGLQGVKPKAKTVIEGGCAPGL
jgi:hypothetical protein